MTHRVPVGVIGVGMHGSRHSRIFADLDRADFVGVYDIDGVVAERAAERFTTRAFPSRAALLKEVEGVSVAVPTYAHHEVTMASLAAGRHVLVEKPMARTLYEADALVAAAEVAGVVLHLGHVERFNAAVQAARPHITEARFIEAHRLSPFQTRGTDVAVILDLLIHDLDLVLEFMGAWPSDIRAVGVPVMTPHVDIVNARLEFPSGAVANLTASRVARKRQRRMRVFQASGYLSLDLAAGVGEFTRLRNGWQPGPQRLSLDEITERLPLGGGESEPLALELLAFLDAVAGDVDHGVSGDAGREALALALEIADVVGANRVADLAV